MTLKKKIIVTVAVLCVLGVCIAPASASLLDWDISSLKEKATNWVTELKDKIHTWITDKTKTYEERVNGQCEALGMTDRLKYYLDAPKTPIEIDAETGEEIGGEPDYSSLEGSWWDKLWGRGMDVSTLPDREEGERLHAEYVANYINYWENVPYEIA